jgi:cytochrome c oxidase assembly protein subunit 11
MEVHPGEIAKTMFHVKNRSDARAISWRAIPSISPNEAAQYFRKTECFCFREQTLEGGAGKAMPMIFYIDPAHSKAHITTVTLSYKFYNLTHQAIAVSR